MRITPTQKARFQALITHLESYIPLALACEYAMLDESLVQAALAAARADEPGELAEMGGLVVAAQARATSDQIAQVLTKGRKDWKSSAFLLSSLAPQFQAKTGLKELGEGIKAAAETVALCLPRKNEDGLLTIDVPKKAPPELAFVEPTPESED